MNTEIALESHLEKRLLKRGSLFFKRCLDLFVSVWGLLLLSPFFLLIALRLRKDSPGPTFYRGARIGQHGKIFHMLKFRTMHEAPSSYFGPRITAQDDPRITPYGRWLRDTKLNELPQLWNVLKGEMSLVGPRPEDPEIAAGWEEEIRKEILSVKPGITSPASVLYRDEEALLRNHRVMEIYVDSILPSKLRLDQLYVRHRSFLLDLDVLFWTLLILIPKIGAIKPPEENLFLGPISQVVRRYLNWFLIDFTITFLSITFMGIMWRSIGPLNLGIFLAVAYSIGFALLFSIIGWIMGINRVAWSHAAYNEVFNLIPGFILATIIALGLNYLTELIPVANRNYTLPKGLIITSASLALLGYVVIRYRSRLLSSFARWWLNRRGQAKAAQERVLIIGGGEAGQYIAFRLNSGVYARNLHILGFVDDDLYKLGTRLNGFPVLGRRSDIPTLVRRHDIGIIIFAIHNITLPERRQLLAICDSTPARVVYMPDIPGAINRIVLEKINHNHNGQTSTVEPKAETSKPPADDLPCSYCLTRLSPALIENWLDELEYLCQKNDLQALHLRLVATRQELHSADSFKLEQEPV